MKNNVEQKKLSNYNLKNMELNNLVYEDLKPIDLVCEKIEECSYYVVWVSNSRRNLVYKHKTGLVFRVCEEINHES